MDNLSLFRQNILKAMSTTFTDTQLKQELHKLINQEVDKEEVPFLLKKEEKASN